MDRLGVSTRAAALEQARLTGNITAAEYAWHKHQMRLDSIAQSYNNLTLKAAGVITIAGVAAMGYAIDKAAKLQQILLSIKNETGADNSKLGGIYNDIFNIGNRDGMDPIAAGEIWRTVSRLTAGQMSVAQMRSVAPMVADFASAIHFNRPDIDVNDAAMVGLQTSHLFRAYTTSALDPLLDKIYRLSGLMSETPEQALRQMSYYEPMFKGLGIDPESSISMMALLDRAGFRNKVGTNVRAMLLEALGPLQMTSFAQSGKVGLLEQMGIFNSQGKFAFNNKDGSTNFLGVLYQLSKWEHEQREKGVPQSELAKELYGVFGRQGGTIASLMSDPTMVAFLQDIHKYLGDPNVSLQAGLKNRDSSLGYQFGRAVANLDSVMIELGYPWLQDLTGFFKSLGDDAHNFQSFLHSHRDIEKAVGGTIAVITGIAGAVVAVGLTSRALTFLGILESMPNAFMLTMVPIRGLIGGLAAVTTGSSAASVGLAAVGTTLKAWATAGAAFLVSPFGLFIAGLIGFAAATTTSAGAGEFKQTDADYLHRARESGWYNLPKTVREHLYAEGWRPNLSRHDDRDIYNIHVTVNGNAKPEDITKAVRKGVEDANDARRRAGANHSKYDPKHNKPLPATVPPK